MEDYEIQGKVKAKFVVISTKHVNHVPEFVKELKKNHPNVYFSLKEVHQKCPDLKLIFAIPFLLNVFFF